MLTSESMKKKYKETSDEGKRNAIKSLQKERCDLYIKMKTAEMEYTNLSKQWMSMGNEIEFLDRDLAMKDGRFKVVEPHGVREKKQTASAKTFTIDEVRELAEKLGVDISMRESKGTTDEEEENK